MKSANCYDRKITQFPQCLPEDVEIIDLSFNRIRKLKKDDLSRYSDIKILYLNDNAIISIDEEIFEGMDDLTTLDLSLNSISKLPAMVFQLPSLKSLYLGQNLNMNIVEVVESAKPVTSPLIQLDISYVMSEEANQLPEFGILPFLTKYVIAENKLKNVTTKQFAGLCSLDKLNTTNVSIEFADPCDCWQINKWLKKRKVQFTLFECEIDRN
ncbi:protein phosphatase 1 regulatory subunit SDS22, partial [Asbolus verrucosus]